MDIDMIIVHVMGGLGNQLYQYALSEKLKTLGKKVKLDLYAYKDAQGEEREWRELELERFDGLEYEVCTKQERTLFLDNSMRFKDRVRRKLTHRRSKMVTEKEDYMPEIFAMDDVYLYGYWGCERYYSDITELLRRKIRFPQSANPANIDAIAEMENTNSVSVHIRRKDYLRVAEGKRYMGICTESYYDSALNYMRGKVDSPIFYIFSDDTEYARTHFNGPDMRIVDWNTGSDSMYDMQLMSSCKHNICANSTFSMWGARLNGHQDKLMLRPLHHDNYETSSPEEIHENWKGWILMNPSGDIVYEK